MKNPKLNGVLKVLLFIAFLIFLQITVMYVFTERLFLNQDAQELKKLANRIAGDLDYRNGRFDISRYSADPYTPYPHGSSGFSLPLYIITTDGFVIERNQPINGFLDSSDFKLMLPYETPQTITSSTDESWRVTAKPLYDKGELIGLILVSYFSPDRQLTAQIDQKLAENLMAIESKLKLSNKKIDVSQIDVRNIHYDVSFEIIDKYNKVLINNGRVPVFIDKSYVSRVLDDPDQQLIFDPVLKERFLTVKKIFYDKGEPVAVIVLGKSVQELHRGLKSYIFFDSVTNLIITLPLLILIVYVKRKEISGFFEKEVIPSHTEPKHIGFDKKSGQIKIGEKTISIPYASNQYYLCEALFSQPKKRWEQDEILERFGEEINPENWRKVYDSGLAINRKTGLKLVICENKTYRINPAYWPALG